MQRQVVPPVVAHRRGALLLVVDVERDSLAERRMFAGEVAHLLGELVGELCFAAGSAFGAFGALALVVECAFEFDDATREPDHLLIRRVVHAPSRSTCTV